jgi:hypothetical protein
LIIRSIRRRDLGILDIPAFYGSRRFGESASRFFGLRRLGLIFVKGQTKRIAKSGKRPLGRVGLGSLAGPFMRLSCRPG